MVEARSADYLVDSVLSNPDTVENLKHDPAPVLRQAANAATNALPITGDKWVYRMVVGFLGGVLIIVAIDLILLAFHEGQKPAPEGLIALGSAAVGALAGLLAPSPSR